MDPNSKLWMDTNRHHLQNLRNGGTKGLILPTMIDIYKKEFGDYRQFPENDFDEILQFMEMLYSKYDKWLSDQK